MRFPTSLRLASLACLGVVLTGCAGEPDPEVRNVRVVVEGVGLDANDMPVLLLEEAGGTRWLPIWIGSPEARAIARHMEAIQTPRPDTHDLARRVIDGMNGEVERVEVTDLRNGTYYAVIALRTRAGRVEIDSRPSDAIAIALRTDAPIFVRERLLSDEDRRSRTSPDRAPSI